jgi:hypothetical protein
MHQEENSMHIEVERELHNLTLETIIHGRCLAKEWLATSALPTGCVRTRILEVLDQLRERKGFYGIDDDLVEEMGTQIRRALNGFRDGIGDRAMSGDVDTIWEQDKDIIQHVNLACRWKEFRAAKRALDDKLAAIQQTDLLLAGLI